MTDKELQKRLKMFTTSRQLEQHYKKSLDVLQHSVINPSPKQVIRIKTKLKKLMVKNRETSLWLMDIQEDDVKLVMHEVYEKGYTIPSVALKYHLSIPTVYRKLQLGRKEVLYNINRAGGRCYD